MKTQTILQTRIRTRLDELGRSARSVSLGAGLDEGYIKNIFHGRSTSPQINRLKQLARELNCDLEYLIGTQPVARKLIQTGQVQLPIVAIISRQVWRPRGNNMYGYVIAPIDRRFASAERVALKVEDSSADSIAVEGSHLIGVDWRKAGIDLLDGTLVAVEELRDNDTLEQYNLRMVKQLEGRLVLMGLDGDEKNVVPFDVEKIKYVITQNISDINVPGL